MVPVNVDISRLPVALRMLEGRRGKRRLASEDHLLRWTCFVLEGGGRCMQ